MRDRPARVGLLGSAAAVLVLVAACQHVTSRSVPDIGCGPDGCPIGADCPGCDPKVCKHPTVHALAHELDHLEKHIDWFGSVVAKVPDVWGQARLTEHRQDFETQMATELDAFEVGLQGSLSRADQAFLAHATALSLAVQPKPPVIGRVAKAPKNEKERQGQQGVRNLVS